MKVSCLFLLGLVLSCHSGNRQDHSDANAVHDLLVDRIFWKPVPEKDHPDRLVNEHQFSITNTSAKHSYHQIRIRVTYYDATYHRIGSANYVVSQRVEPRSVINVGKVQLETVNPAAKSSTVTIEQAETD